jgi:hypothetical protein
VPCFLLERGAGGKLNQQPPHRKLPFFLGAPQRRVETRCAYLRVEVIAGIDTDKRWGLMRNMNPISGVDAGHKR